MVSIKPINILNKITNSRFLEKNLYKPATENPAKFAGRMALISALSKDAVGCYYYVTQSLNNERIPEDKRNFVASLDLMNGILNVGLQFTVGSWLDKKAPDWFNKYAEKTLSTDKTRKISKFITDKINLIKKPEAQLNTIDVENFIRNNKILGKSGKIASFLKIGFSAFTMLFATQVVTKRIIVPSLSTPLAGWYKEKFLDKKKKPEIQDRKYYEVKNAMARVNSEKPSMTALDKVSSVQNTTK